MKPAVLVLLLALSFVTACNRRPAHTVQAFSLQVQSAEGEALTARLKAAMEITSLEERGKALSQLALDAAKAAEGDVTVAALENINVLSQRDAAAEQCAIALSQAGHPELATRAAKTISSVATRDRAMSAIATGAKAETKSEAPLKDKLEAPDQGQ